MSRPHIKIRSRRSNIAWTAEKPTNKNFYSLSQAKSLLKSRTEKRQTTRERKGLFSTHCQKYYRYNLGLKAYKKIWVPTLTGAHVAQRFSFSHWIKNNFTHERSRLILFSDEKMFNEDGSLRQRHFGKDRLAKL